MSQGLTRDIPLNADGTLAANKDTCSPTQKATKTYVDGKVSAVTDATLPFSDVTTNNFSSTKHGWAPKNPNDATKYMTGEKTYVAQQIYEDSWGEWMNAFIAILTTNVADNLGCTRSDSGTFTHSAGSSVQSPCANIALPASTVGSLGYQGTETNATGNWLYGRVGHYVAYVRLVDTTNIRVMVGVKNLTPTAAVASDLPVGSYAMFRFSSSSGDTTWKLVIGDGTTIEVIDTQISASASSMVRLEIRWDGTATNSFYGYINGVQVAHGTLNPASTDIFNFGATFTNVSSGVRNLKLAGQFIRTKF